MTEAAIVVHYTGHRIAGAAVHTPFAADQEGRVAGEIARALDELPIAAAFGSLAAGADLLFAEAFRQRGVPLHLVFPFDLELFRAISVRPSGEVWLERFDRLLPHAASVRVLRGERGTDPAFRCCTLQAMARALRDAGRNHAQALQLAVWDGRSPSHLAGTAADVALWRRRGLPTRVIAAG